MLRGQRARNLLLLLPRRRSAAVRRGKGVQLSHWDFARDIGTEFILFPPAFRTTKCSLLCAGQGVCGVVGWLLDDDRY
jgi:hypothetical protein